MMPISPYFDIKHDPDDGRRYLATSISGVALLRMSFANKGTAFSEEERKELKLEGLLPPVVHSLEEQIDRVYRGFRGETDEITRYQYLRSLQERNEVLFYALLVRHLDEMLPIIYTPTVGRAVQEYSYLYRYPRGLSLSPLNIDRATQAVGNYPWNDVRMIVATDSSAILGIGDQGYGGLAIAIGKLALYTAAGGVSPVHTMPVKLDVGTDRMDLVEDPLYLGVRQRRLRGEDYLAFVDRFVDAVEARWPNAILQWEDLSKDVAFTVLERYRKRIPSFNDDIQGTGAVALAGLLVACRRKNETLSDQRVVILGAGAGGAGVAMAVIDGLMREGLNRDQARERVFVLDSRGLLVEGRPMDGYKQSLAQAASAIDAWEVSGPIPDLLEVIEHVQATALLGLSGQCGAFNEPVLRALCRHATHPIVFPLSNPTSASEAHPADIFAWTEGRALVATGSPFPDVEYRGQHCPVGQGNNAFIFPGLGLGAILAGCRQLTDAMVLEAAYALAEYTISSHLDQGRVYPPVDQLQEVSIRVASRVIERALEDGVARATELADRDLDAHVRAHFWRPEYLPVTSIGCGG